MKKMLLVLTGVLSLSAVFATAADASKWNGWISDSMCGAKHAGTGAGCAKKCIEGGMSPVFVDEKKTVWAIDNPDTVKEFYGDRVAATVVANSAKKSVHIQAINELK